MSLNEESNLLIWTNVLDEDGKAVTKTERHIPNLGNNTDKKPDYCPNCRKEYDIKQVKNLGQDPWFIKHVELWKLPCGHSVNVKEVLENEL